MYIYNYILYIYILFNIFGRSNSRFQTPLMIMDFLQVSLLKISAKNKKMSGRIQNIPCWIKLPVSYVSLPHTFVFWMISYYIPKMS